LPVVEALQVLLPLGFLAAMIFARPLFVWLRDRRLLQAMDAPLDGSSCPACEGDHVTTYAAECHRCDRCGIEWGAGRAAHASLQRREALASRPRRERLELAIAELRTAIAHLDAAANALSHGPSDADLVVAAARLAWALLYPRWRLHDDEPELRQDARLRAQPDAERALEHIQRAADAWPECVLTTQRYPGATPDADWIASVRASADRTLAALEHTMQQATQPPDR
jgi:hypothetical protein